MFVGRDLRRMENSGEKNGENAFLVSVWLGGEKSGENIFLVNNALHPLLYPLCPIGTSYMVTFILASTNPSYGIEPCNAHPWCSQVSSQPHTKKSESVSTKL